MSGVTVCESAAAPAGEGLLLCGRPTQCNMQCALSAPYLLSSAVTEVRVLARACVFVVTYSSERGAT